MNSAKLSALLRIGLLLVGLHSTVYADIADPGDNAPNGSDVTPLNTPTAVTQSVTGRTIGGGDLIDWYSVNLVSGNTYLFDTSSFSADPVMSIYQNFDAAVAQAPAATDDDSGIGLNPSIQFTATESGTHYVSITPWLGTLASLQSYDLNYTLLSGNSGGSGGGSGSGGSAEGSHIGITGTPIIVSNLPVVVISLAEKNGKMAMISGEASPAPGTDDGSDTDAATTESKEEAEQTEGIPALVSVEFRYRNNAETWSEWEPVTGLESWWADFSFDPDKGTYLVQLRATDASGEQSIPKMTMIQN